MDDSRCDDGKSIRFCKALTLAVQPRVDRKCEQPHGRLKTGSVLAVTWVGLNEAKIR